MTIVATTMSNDDDRTVFHIYRLSSTFSVVLNALAVRGKRVMRHVKCVGTPMLVCHSRVPSP